VPRAVAVGAALVLLALLVCIFRQPPRSDYATAEVLSVGTKGPSPEPSMDGLLSDVNLRVLDGPLAGRTFVAPVMNDPQSGYSMDVRPGDVVVVVTERKHDDWQVGIDEFHRIPALFWLFLTVVGAILLVGRWQGLQSLLALAVTLVLVFGVLTRLLVAGHPPVALGIAFAALVTALTLLLVGGFTTKALVATVGTVGGVAAAGFLGWVAMTAMHLSGFTGHESVYLQYLEQGLDFRGLLLCAIIIGALGAVMDVCMSLATSLEELAANDAGADTHSLFRSGMKMGSDLLGTMTNTLVLAYTGSSLTLVLLLTAQRADFPAGRLLNMEFISVEIVRSLAGLFGMAAAIPISAAAGAWWFAKNRRRPTRPSTAG